MGRFASLEEKTWLYLELAEVGMAGARRSCCIPLCTGIRSWVSAWGRDGATHPRGAQCAQQRPWLRSRDSWARTKGHECLRGSNKSLLLGKTDLGALLVPELCHPQ